MLSRIGGAYARLSTRNPHTVAASSACAIMTSADLLCQTTVQRDAEKGIDWRRTAGISLFAFVHYGGPAKFLYLWYDRAVGTAPTLRNAALKMGIDVRAGAPSNR